MKELSNWAAGCAEVFSAKQFTAIIPDLSRSGGRHVGEILRGIYRAKGGQFEELSVLIALGTHPPIELAAICSYLGFSREDLATMPKLRFINHSEDDLVSVGHVSRDDWLELSTGKMDLADFGFAEGVPVRFNRHAVEADEVCIVGPVLPHEVVGCSGGFKYLTPGIGAKELTGLTHWLGAVLTIPGVIGVVETPVRSLIEHCARMMDRPRVFCAAFVVEDEALKCKFFGSPIEAHRLAAAETLRHNVEYTGRTFPRVVGCLAERYDELWTGGKASYKLIQLVEPGGELIIYAPHLSEVSATWGDQISRIGYHSLEFVAAHLQRFLAEGISPAVLAHVTHVYGPGTFTAGIESPSVVRLAAGFSESFTKDSLNLGYCDPASLDFADLQSDPDTYLSRNAGQRLVLPASG